PWVVLGGMDLRALTGGEEQPALVVDPLVVGGVLGGVLAVTALAVLVATATSSRADLAGELRIGEDTCAGPGTAREPGQTWRHREPDQRRRHLSRDPPAREPGQVWSSEPDEPRGRLRRSQVSERPQRLTPAPDVWSVPHWRHWPPAEETTMSDSTYQLISLIIYFVAMLAIGYYAYRRTTGHEDYMLAGRRLNPVTAALSAGASDMSGWLMMGLPGAIYAVGLIESWIAVGLTIGAYLNWRLVAPRLRAYTETARNSITIPSFFENRLHDRSRSLRVASGAIVLVFFTFYVSSMMVAGGEFFVLAFGTSYLTGMLIVVAVTLSYTLFGGFLAASLTDVVQGTMMMLALLAVPVV